MRRATVLVRCSGTSVEGSVLSWGLKDRTLHHHSQQVDKCSWLCQNVSTGSAQMCQVDNDTNTGEIASEALFPLGLQSYTTSQHSHVIKTSEASAVSKRFLISSFRQKEPWQAEIQTHLWVNLARTVIVPPFKVSEYYFSLWELICHSIIHSPKQNEIVKDNRGM